GLTRGRGGHGGRAGGACPPPTEQGGEQAAEQSPARRVQGIHRVLLQGYRGVAAASSAPSGWVHGRGTRARGLNPARPPSGSAAVDPWAVQALPLRGWQSSVKVVRSPLSVTEVSKVTLPSRKPRAEKGTGTGAILRAAITSNRGCLERHRCHPF